MKQALATIVIALACFFILPVLGVQLEVHVALSFGVLLGGTVAILLSGNPAQSDESAPEISATLETKTLYVGNLPYRANEAAVRELFEQYGTVVSVRLMRDRNTGKRKGFGFVEIAASGLDSAVEALNDSEFQQRTLKVREAKDKTQRDISDDE